MPSPYSLVGFRFVGRRRQPCYRLLLVLKIVVCVKFLMFSISKVFKLSCRPSASGETGFRAGLLNRFKAWTGSVLLFDTKLSRFPNSRPAARPMEYSMILGFQPFTSVWILQCSIPRAPRPPGQQAPSLQILDLVSLKRAPGSHL